MEKCSLGFCVLPFVCLIAYKQALEGDKRKGGLYLFPFPRAFSRALFARKRGKRGRGRLRVCTQARGVGIHVWEWPTVHFPIYVQTGKSASLPFLRSPVLVSSLHASGREQKLRWRGRRQRVPFALHLSMTAQEGGAAPEFARGPLLACRLCTPPERGGKGGGLGICALAVNENEEKGGQQPSLFLRYSRVCVKGQERGAHPLPFASAFLCGVGRGKAPFHSNSKGERTIKEKR